MVTNIKNCAELSYRKFLHYPKYKIIDEYITSVDKTGKGYYVELTGLDYSDCWGRDMVQMLSEKNPDYYYQIRFREYLKTKGESKYRIVTDFVKSIYHDGERIK